MRCRHRINQLKTRGREAGLSPLCLATPQPPCDSRHHGRLFFESSADPKTPPPCDCGSPKTKQKLSKDLRRVHNHTHTRQPTVWYFLNVPIKTTQQAYATSGITTEVGAQTQAQTRAHSHRDSLFIQLSHTLKHAHALTPAQTTHNSKSSIHTHESQPGHTR